MHVIGRGRYARATYPVGGQSSALVALTNRYLTSPTPAIPSPFTVTQPTLYIVAAVNVTRRASGFFMVSVQLLDTLAGADTQEWAAVAMFGATASGGNPDGSWLVAGPAITTTTPSGTSGFGGQVTQSSAGNLTQTVTLVGVNPNPLPAGSSAIVITGTTVGGQQITPGLLFASAYELP